MDIVLASASPRRIELMRRAGFENCIVMPAGIDENEQTLTPQSAAALSRRKADAVARDCPPEAVIIAADTLVVCSGRVLGKPDSEEDAFNMLRMLSGRGHTVVTGVTVRRGALSDTRAETTDVWFRALTDRQIRGYVATGEPLDKAGAYGIQDRGALLVERIEGDYFNVMGLPLCLLSRMLLENFRIDMLSPADV